LLDCCQGGVSNRLRDVFVCGRRLGATTQNADEKLPVVQHTVVVLKCVEGKCVCSGTAERVGRRSKMMRLMRLWNDTYSPVEVAAGGALLVVLTNTGLLLPLTGGVEMAPGLVGAILLGTGT
jgi:hypothetical protein